jgi:N-acetyl sugar amidotransferase
VSFYHEEFALPSNIQGDALTTAAQYQVCTRCVMDTTDTAIWFDQTGLCRYCVHYDENLRATVESAQRGGRQHELEALVGRIKAAGAGKAYDCIVGVSGGVDSSYVALQAIQLGLRPLAVHFDSGWNSELAVSNVEGIVSKLDLDLYTDVVDWREMRDLQLAFLRSSVANSDTPTDHAFPAVAYRQASKYGIRYILSGSNLATESILPKSWGYNSADAVQLRAIHRRFGSRRLKSYPVMGILRRYFWYQRVRRIQIVKFLNFMPYVKTDAKKAISEKLGWRDYGGKHHESVFTRYFQGYYLPTKFGFDKRRAHLSSLINADQISRDQALEELEMEPYDASLKADDHKFIAKKLGISTDELDALVRSARKDYKEYPNQEWLFDLLLRVRSRLFGKNGTRH